MATSTPSPTPHSTPTATPSPCQIGGLGIGIQGPPAPGALTLTTVCQPVPVDTTVSPPAASKTTLVLLAVIGIILAYHIGRGLQWVSDAKEAMRRK